MRKIIIAAVILFPFFCSAQLVVRDTIIGGKVYHIYPFRMEYYNETSFDHYSLDDFNRMVVSAPQIPSVSDSLPDGEYVMLTPVSKDRGRTSANRKYEGWVVAKFVIVGGLKNGPCAMYMNGIDATGSYNNDLKDGVWKYYMFYKRYEFNYRQGILNGKAYEYYHKKMYTQANFIDNKMIGDYYLYYPNGRIKYYTKFINNGEQDYSKGEFRIEASNLDSLEISYYKNGQVKSMQLCNKGWKSLNSINYYSNGKISKMNKIKAYVDSEQKFVVENIKYDRDGKITLYNQEEIFTDPNFPSTNTILTVEFDKNGDTSHVVYQRNPDTGFVASSEYSLRISEKYFTKKNSKNGISKIVYVYSFGEPVENIYENGRPKIKHELLFAENRLSYTLVKKIYDLSGKFCLKQYNTYSKTQLEAPFLKVPASDTFVFYYKDKSITGEIKFPKENKVKDRGIFQFEYYPDFNLWEEDFIYIDTTYRAAGKKYKLNRIPNEYTDSVVKIIFPVVDRKKYKQKNIHVPNLSSISVNNGKVSGLITIKSDYTNYKDGLRHGLWIKDHYNYQYGYFYKGLKNGEFVSQEYHRTIKREQYSNDTLNGLSILYEGTTSQPYIVSNYKMGKLHGDYLQLWPETNDTTVFINFKNGEMQGKAFFKTYITIENVSLYIPPVIYRGQVYYTKPATEGKWVKQFEMNLENGGCRGKQYQYGKDGSLVHEVDVTDTNYYFSSISLSVSNGEVNSYSVDEGMFNMLHGIHKCYYKSKEISEVGEVGFYKIGLVRIGGNKINTWNYYREDGSIYKQIKHRDSLAKLDLENLKLDTNIQAYSIITTYHRNGKVYERGLVTELTQNYDCNQDRYVQDEKVSYYSIQDSNGNYIFQNGTGNLTIYNTNGLLKAKGKQVKGLREGFWIYYDPNGNPTEAGNYMHGKKDGRWLKGDLRGFHFIDNQCFSEDVDQEIIKSKSEKNLTIEETIYINGEYISSNRTSFERSK